MQILISLFVLVSAQGPNEAEKLFRDSERKLIDAEYVQITVSGGAKDSRGQISLKGTVLMAKGNKSRLELEGKEGPREYKFTLVSNGAQTQTHMSTGDKRIVQDTPKNANKMLAGVTHRTGVLTAMLMHGQASGVKQKPAELDDMIAVSDFNLGKKETIGERNAQRVDYKLTIATGTNKRSVAAQVWLDTETNLPLKRLISEKQGEKAMEITESYEVRVNVKIEASKFELPK